VSEKVRVAIVGSGPAGLSAAAHAAKLGLSHVLLEKTDHLSDTIYKYQKGKHIMATPTQLLLRSDVHFAEGKREPTLAQWDEDAKVNGVNVKYNADVVKIEGEKGDFRLTTAAGDTVNAEVVVLGIGVQGNPNTLNVPGDLSIVQYQLDDPGEYIDEHIVVIGGGDAGIENAMGLIADSAQKNTVTLLQFAPDFPTAKGPNVSMLMAARDAGRCGVYTSAKTTAIEPGERRLLVVDTPNGEVKIPVDRVIARIGAAPPRKFLDSIGIQFASADRFAFPTLSPQFETSVPGIYVIGALAGYPLIKHCMNQGHDVIEFIEGNSGLKPADEPLLVERFKGLKGGKDVDYWLDYIRQNVEVFRELSPLQMREFMIEADVHSVPSGKVIFNRADAGSSLWFVANGSVAVEIDPNDRVKQITIPAGQFFGEIGLISGRRRSATVRAAQDSILVELPRNMARKLMAQVPAAGEVINRTMTERELMQVFGPGLTREDLAEVMAKAEYKSLRANEVLIQEGDAGLDLFVVRYGSLIVEKAIAGKPIFLSYLPAGSFVGEMSVITGAKRSATVRAAIKSDVVKIDGAAFRALLERKPDVLKRLQAQMAQRSALNTHIEAQRESFGSVVEYHSETARFMVANGLGEATDVLLIDETLCVGCDNCERACADAHDGLSRLDREAGKTFAHLHVPTSCRHCEHPHCMSDCPPNAIQRGADGEVKIDDTCIGCGNCERFCPYGVIRLDYTPPKKPSLLSWLLFGFGPGPGEPSHAWAHSHRKKGGPEPHKHAVKCDMCAGIDGGPSCVRACPTGAAIRISPEQYLKVALRHRETA
jgi:CRP-like cAMP-binding protein/Fe-S-cluster-containing hydrogenase component 2/thioredoxin reductase